MAGTKAASKPTPPAASPVIEDDDFDESGYDPEIDALPSPVGVKPAAQAGQTVPPVTSTKKPVEAKPKHPAHLLRAASSLGMADDEVNALATDELRSTIRDLRDDQEWERKLRVAERATVHPESPDVPTDNASLPRPAAASTQPAESFSLGLSKEEEEEIAPGLLKALKAVATELNDNREVRKLVGALKHREINREATTRAGMIDAAFDHLGKDYEKYFGAGTGAEMKNDSSEMQRRMAIIKAASIDWSKGAAHVKQQIKKAAELVYPPAPEPYTEVPSVPTNGHGPTEEQKRWTEAQLQRPSNRESPQPKGRKAAIAATQAKMRELNIGGGDEELDLPE